MAEIAPHLTSFVDNGEGWLLEIRRYGDPRTRTAGLAPVVLVPGYAMNSYILAFHPGGDSLVGDLVRRGFEVWTANLRGQGGSRRIGRTEPFGMRALALVDLAVVFAFVRAHTATGVDRVAPIGCSLGGALVYAWLAHHPTDHGCDRAVAIGGPLRWETLHPLLRGAFASAHLAGSVPVRGTRRMAALALPWLKHLRPVLGIYMNPDGVDLSQISNLVPTVDDPVRKINAELARWVQSRELRVGGISVAEGLRSVTDVPILALCANRDGIVPPAVARSVEAYVPADQLTVRVIGDDDRWYAHADLFIGHHAREDVFAPLADWLSSPRSAPA